MPRLTSKTITEPDRYLAVLEDVRTSGFSTDMGESEEGACCVGVALEWPSSSIRAAISLSSPAARFPLDDLAEVAGELRRTARDVSVAVSGASR